MTVENAVIVHDVKIASAKIPLIGYVLELIYLGGHSDIAPFKCVAAIFSVLAVLKDVGTAHIIGLSHKLEYLVDARFDIGRAVQSAEYAHKR